jgi:GNAT superfamily N-acetyltransferase
MMEIHVRQLSECPQHLGTVGQWIYEQWWCTPENSVEVVLSLLRLHMRRDTVPYTVVALQGQTPVGSCCVIEHDCAHRPQYSPWVAAVFVLDGFRRRGIASSVLREAVQVARRAGVESLYIDCHVNTVPLYEKNGWRVLEEEPVRKGLTANAAHDTFSDGLEEGVGDDHSVVMRMTTLARPGSVRHPRPV